MVVETKVGKGKVGSLINGKFTIKYFYLDLYTGIRLRFNSPFLLEICFTGKTYNHRCDELWRKYPTEGNPLPSSITQQSYYLCLQQC